MMFIKTGQRNRDLIESTVNFKIKILKLKMMSSLWFL